ncbi:hypothetical protein [Flavobacterium cerinum]|uniref:Uncharacterized protein n=1 Tax=Flavobacterium cerinum TaxID=2502784 RepID=A0ABY5ISM3_9FLAO|nr:hypothetical protein [Flavobacterium cerinum]UUC45852.1 hypothetical protein NOX80_01300 [Flavobacterium cerinum]
MKKMLLVLILATGLLQTSCSEDLVSSSIATNSADVYVAGQRDNQACYWKNNQLNTLETGGNHGTTANKIIVSNNDIYVLGIGLGTTVETIPMFWKNGVLTNLKTSLSTNEEVVTSITDMEIIGNDVYFVGYTKKPIITFDDYTLAYWKNGVKTVIRNYGSIVQNLPKIQVANNNVYVTASSTGSETLNGYYTNSVFNEIPNATLNGLATNGNQVFAYGVQNNAGYYKNINTNAETTLPAPINGVTKMYATNDLYVTNGTNTIYKNGISFENSQPELGGIMDFKIQNSGTYKITQIAVGDGYTSHLVVNGVEAMHINDSDGTFLSIFVVQN